MMKLLLNVYDYVIMIDEEVGMCGYDFTALTTRSNASGPYFSI